MNDERNSVKIFGIGLNKTGTSTLRHCGNILGYRCIGCNKKLLKDVIAKRDFTHIKETVSRYDLFEDWPWPLIYKELDVMYPGSKFILTVRRNETVWLDSLMRHSMRSHPTHHCRKLVFGHNFPQRWGREHMDFYVRHNNEVRAYFSGRDSDFREICWENGDGWEKLCEFLGKDVPDIPLPHANKGAECSVRKGRYLMNKFLSYLGI